MTGKAERTYIRDLIDAAIAERPIRDEQHAREFLDNFLLSDRCALITAAYLGELRTPNGIFLEEDEPVNRYTITGNTDGWVIPPEKHAECLFAKAERLAEYYHNFLRCAKNSGYNLENF